jgi:hypothetical protein
MSKTAVLVTLKHTTHTQVWETPYTGCHHKPLGNFMCWSTTTIHSQR